MKFFEADKRAACWRELRLEAVALPPAMQAYVDLLARELGKVAAFRLRAHGADELFELVTYENWKYSQLATELWKHAPLAELVHTPSPTVEACLVPAHAFDVCAFLANILVRGGAQSRGDHVTFRGRSSTRWPR